MNKRYTYNTISIILGILASLGVGFVVGNYHVLGEGHVDSEHREVESEYQFISPLLECEITQPVFYKNLRGIKQTVSDFIDTEKRKGNLTFVSVYFRDLTNGPWFGIREDTEFRPSSLSKVPIMISYLKQAEIDSSLLDTSIPFSKGTLDSQQRYIPLKTLESGKTYTTKELLKQMMVYSDNDALDSLLKSDLIDSVHIDDVYHDLGIDTPTHVDSNIDVHTYASFFRILYNATYLSKEFSEFALSLLSESVFDDGLRAGVFKSIPIAHKFGEGTDPTSGEKQLHDCGIVYFPGRPYVLCVMTRGDSFEELSGVIAEISKIVYESVKKQ